MRRKSKEILHQLVIFIPVGIAFGIAVGYTTPMNFPTAIAMCLSCSVMIQVFESLAEAYVFPRFERFSRGKKLTLRLIFSLFTHISGWLLPIWITGVIIGFSLFHWQFIMWLGVFICVVIITHSFHTLVSFYRELREKDVLEEKLKTLAAQAELKALRAQINPHFLFNSLNTIASLIASDPSKAEESIERLAEIFRYALTASDKEFVTLKDELEFIESYLEIEKARFGERLQINRDIPPEIMTILIPSLVLQPLVENSIKHGSDDNGKMSIEIRALRDGSLVRIMVKDTGKGVPDEIKKGLYTAGTGLRNVSERLHRVYGERYGLEIKENMPAGCVALVTIPLEGK
jgi:signal transduction histidine kinase